MVEHKLFHDQLLPSEFMNIWFSNDLLAETEKGEFQRYYRNYYNNFSSFLGENYDIRLEEAIDLIRSKGGNLKVLDIGTGCGSEALYFANLGCDVLGIDLEKKRLDVANSRKRMIEENTGEKLDCEFQLKSVFDLDQEKKFDLIWIMETFHHIEPREKFVAILSNLLKKNGTLIISETNSLNPLHQILMFKTRGFQTIKKKIDANGLEHLYGRERIITSSKLNRTLKKNKISCLKIKYFRVVPWSNPGNFLSWVNKNFPRILKPFFIHYNYIGFKKNIK